MDIKAKTDKSIKNTLMGELLGGSAFGNIIDKASRSAGFSMLDVVKTRIFNESGGKNSKGQLFGTYNKQYQKIREKKKNRTNKQINIMFSGDTELQFTLGVNNGDYCLGFTAEPNGSKNPNAAQKAEYMEERYNDNFLGLSESEVKQFNDTFIFEFDRLMKK